MRQPKRATATNEAWDFLASRHVVHIAAAPTLGAPLLRVLNCAVHDGWVMFHGGVVGEKYDLIDQPAVISAYEEVARIPSYFIDPELACPATTYYRSVQARGIVREVLEPERKAATLQAFMRHQQPEGGHAPIRAEDPVYRKNLAGVRVFGLEVEEIVGKESLGHDRPPERTRKVVEGLWRRGEPGDTRAIRIILDRSPRATPAWLIPPEPLASAGIRLVVDPHPHELRRAAELLRNEYWRAEDPIDEIVASHERSSAWVGALDDTGALLGAARALADGASRGGIYDVIVAPEHQRRGIGRALMRLLLDHPAVRNCTRVMLATRDREAFYEPFGFSARSAGTLMVRARQSMSMGPDSSCG